MPKQVLVDGINALDMSISEEQTETLWEYIELLAKWNKAYNLTAVRDKKQMVIRHLLDSLVVAPFITGQRIIDVGSGAGIPGIPLAILYPEKQIVMLDSNGKKVRFIDHAILTLSLSNAKGVKERVENFTTEDRFDHVVSRAFASLHDMVVGCEQMLNPDGTFLAMKGMLSEGEVKDMPERFEHIGTEKMTVPFLDEERHLLHIKKKQ